MHTDKSIILQGLSVTHATLKTVANLAKSYGLLESKKLVASKKLVVFQLG